MHELSGVAKEQRTSLGDPGTPQPLAANQQVSLDKFIFNAQSLEQGSSVDQQVALEQALKILGPHDYVSFQLPAAELYTLHLTKSPTSDGRVNLHLVSDKFEPNGARYTSIEGRKFAKQFDNCESVAGDLGAMVDAALTECVNQLDLRRERLHTVVFNPQGYHEPDTRECAGPQDTGGQNTYVNKQGQAMAKKGIHTTVLNLAGPEHPIHGDTREPSMHYRRNFVDLMFVDIGSKEFVAKETMYPVYEKGADGRFERVKDGIFERFGQESARLLAGNKVDIVEMPYADGAGAGKAFYDVLAKDSRAELPQILLFGAHSMGEAKAFNSWGFDKKSGKIKLIDQDPNEPGISEAQSKRRGLVNELRQLRREGCGYEHESITDRHLDAWREALLDNDLGADSPCPSLNLANRILFEEEVLRVPEITFMSVSAEMTRAGQRQAGKTKEEILFCPGGIDPDVFKPRGDLSRTDPSYDKTWADLAFIHARNTGRLPEGLTADSSTADKLSALDSIVKDLQDRTIVEEYSRAVETKGKHLLLEAFGKVVEEFRAAQLSFKDGRSIPHPLLIMNIPEVPEIKETDSEAKKEGAKYASLLRSIIDKYDMADFVVHQPSFSHHQIAQMHQLARVYVTAALSEPWGLTPNEAAAANKKMVIISSDKVKAMLYGENHKQMALLFDPKDSEPIRKRLSAVLKVDWERPSHIVNNLTERSEKAHQRAIGFSWREMKTELLKKLGVIFTQDPNSGEWKASFAKKDETVH